MAEMEFPKTPDGARNGAQSPLVDASWLRAHLRDPQLRIVDLRWYLHGKRGRDEYAKGHIEGAVFLDLEADLTAPRGPGRHPIPSAEMLSLAMQGAGVSAGAWVVVYDDAGGSIAARLWWLLRHYGHTDVAVLDGGLAAWTESGGALSVEVPRVERGTFRARAPRADEVVDKDAIRLALASGALVLDARVEARYRGDLEPVDARPGHIPGARNAPWTGNLDPRGRFNSERELRRRYEALGAAGASEVVVYCGSGVTACHDLLALEIAGLPGAKLYEGSWGDWAKDPTLPAAIGDV